MASKTARPTKATNDRKPATEKHHAAPAAAAASAEGAASGSSSKRVPQPDDKKHTQAMAELKTQREAIDKRLEELREKMKATTNINTTYDAKTNELTNQLNKIGAERKRLREERGVIATQIRDSRPATKPRDTEAIKKKLPYNTVAEFDRAITALQQKIASGKLKMLEEKQASAEIASLQKGRKQLESLEEPEEAASSSADPVADAQRNALDAKGNDLTAVDKHYDDIRAELNSLRDKKTADLAKWKALCAERDELKAQVDVLETKRRELETAHRAANEEYYKWQAEENVRQREAKRQLREQMQLEKKKAQEERRREERTLPKFETEIALTSALMSYLQLHYPTGDAAKNEPAVETKKAEAEEGVTVLAKKGERVDEVYFVGKKNKDAGKGKQAAAPAQPKKSGDAAIKLPLGTLEDFWKLKVEVPATVADVPKALDALRKTKAHWETRQKEELEKGLREEAAERTAPVANGNAQHADAEGQHDDAEEPHEDAAQPAHAEDGDGQPHDEQQPEKEDGEIDA